MTSLLQNPDESKLDSLAWQAAAGDLANATTNLLNRRDCCGGYRPGHPTTRKDTDWDWLPMLAALKRHFRGERPIGLHTTAPANVVRWIAFDVDAHGDEDVAELNHSTAMTIAERLRARGLKPYMFDSNGRGGYHVWAVLSKLTPSEDAYALAREVGGGLAECFPKQPRIREGGYGNWVRLPAKHPRRGCWSRLWMGNRWGTARETIAGVIEMGRAARLNGAILTSEAA